MKACTDWSAFKDDQRHRSTEWGYANPDIADDLALRAIDVIERKRRAMGCPPESVVLCGVDNSTTALAMAVLRLCPPHERYSFASGRKGRWECDGELCLDGYDRNHSMFVVVDDDICRGHALQTVVDEVASVYGIHWIGIMFGMECEEMMHSEWLSDVASFTWFGDATYADSWACLDPDSHTVTGEELAGCCSEDEE